MAARKKTRSKKSGARKKAPAKTAFQRFEAELPPDLRGYSRRVRRGLTKLEREIETAQKDARRRWARLLRDVSHQLGSIEAAGEKRWRERTLKARREAVKLLQRLEKAIQPPTPRKKKATARKTGGRAKAAARPGVAAKSLPDEPVQRPVGVALPMPPPPPL
jgi:hypothetical protein